MAMKLHLPVLLDVARTTPALADPVPILGGCQKGVAANLNTGERRPQTHAPKGSFSLQSLVACANQMCNHPQYLRNCGVNNKLSQWHPLLAVDVVYMPVMYF